MSRTVLAVLLLAAVPSMLPCRAGAQSPPAAPPVPYTAHEWGTFTAMVGQQGIALEGLHHEEEALPAFVHDLLSVREHAVDDGKLPASKVTQKMETPVIYFHAEQPLRVRVSVWFQKGLMSQFYPLPNRITPVLETARQQRLDLSKVDGSSLQWEVDVIPHAAEPPAGIPKIGNDEPWGLARQTSSCYVRTVPEADSPAHPEAEHYLFYRGLGRWTPALQLRAEAGGRVTVTNAMPQEVPFAAVLELGEQGGRFCIGKAMPNGASQAFALAGTPWIQDRKAVATRLGAHVLQALTAQGLFPDEARAMVATWSRSWFQKDGARVLYLLPRQQVDAVLPLSLEPPPQQLVRVLVGRLEYITPEAQARVEAALRQAGDGDAGHRAAAEAVFAGLDRFLEPHLRQVLAHGAPDVRSAAEQRLAALLAGPVR